MRLLDNPVRPYAWGSRTAIATLQGREPAAGPEAELWMGAHPSAPSVLRGGSVPLTAAIAADPVGVLGQRVLDRFGARLPFMVKVLAAEAPLSLQAHPDAAQAAAGFAAEETAGMALGHPGRNYVDASHKPELLVAVTEFEALCGFRDPGQTAALLASLDVAALAPLVRVLTTAPGADGLRTAMAMLMAWPAPDRGGLVAAVAAAGHPLGGRLAKLYPDDMGVVVALLLNHVRLKRDEAVYLPAGNLHAYLSGVGVEVMAASDNVLRGGLTPKHVDVAELLSVLRYEVLAEPVVVPTLLAPGVLTWAAPAPEFFLVKALVAGVVTLPGAGPRVLCCMSGELRLRAGLEEVTVRGGEAAFVTAAEPAVEVAGSGVVFQASPHPSL